MQLTAMDTTGTGLTIVMVRGAVSTTAPALSLTRIVIENVPDTYE